MLCCCGLVADEPVADEPVANEVVSPKSSAQAHHGWGYLAGYLLGAPLTLFGLSQVMDDASLLVPWRGGALLAAGIIWCLPALLLRKSLGVRPRLWVFVLCGAVFAIFWVLPALGFAIPYETKGSVTAVLASVAGCGSIAGGVWCLAERCLAGGAET